MKSHSWWQRGGCCQSLVGWHGRWGLGGRRRVVLECWFWPSLLGGALCSAAAFNTPTAEGGRGLPPATLQAGQCSLMHSACRVWGSSPGVFSVRQRSLRQVPSTTAWPKWAAVAWPAHSCMHRAKTASTIPQGRCVRCKKVGEAGMVVRLSGGPLNTDLLYIKPA